jgi:hypothetical protein
MQPHRPCCPKRRRLGPVRHPTLCPWRAGPPLGRPSLSVLLKQPLAQPAGRRARSGPAVTVPDGGAAPVIVTCTRRSTPSAGSPARELGLKAKEKK